MTRIPPLRVLLSGAAVLAALSPLTFSPVRGITTKTAACADGTCCTEEGSLCYINGVRIPNAYYKGAGSCTPIKQ